MPQIRNDEHIVLQMADLVGRQNAQQPEALGDLGVYNGQFELGDPYDADNPDPYFPDGWESIVYSGGSLTRVTGGLAGNYCMKGGQAGTGRGGYLITQRYFPVDADRDYYISAAFKGASANSRVYLGAVCYDANKVQLGSVYAVSAATPGISWVRYQRRIGPNGDVAWLANTRYARVRVILQHDVTLTNDWAYVDDVQLQQVKPATSSTLHLIDDYVKDVTNRNFTAQAYTQHAGSVLSVTLEEESYLWIFFNATVANVSNARSQSFQSKVFIDGVGEPGVNICSSPAIFYFMTDNWCIRSQSSYAAGAHTIDYRLYVANAGDTVTVYDLTGAVFAARRY